MLQVNHKSIQTPWPELDEVFNGDGLPHVGLCIMPRWDIASQSKLVGAIIAHQRNVENQDLERTDVDKTPAYITVGKTNARYASDVAHYIAKEDGDEKPTSSIYYADTKFSKRGKFYQCINSDTPTCAVVDELAQACRVNDMEIRIIHIPEVLASNHLDITLAKLRVAALKYNCLVIIGVDIPPNVSRLLSQEKITPSAAIVEFKNMVMLERLAAQADFVMHAGRVTCDHVQITRGKFRSSLTPLSKIAILNI